MRLLDPALRIVPFAGRDAEMAELGTWAGGTDPVRVRLLTGMGGSGKSRLGVELSSRLARRRWRTVRLDPADDPRDLAEACRGARTLVVVDDAGSFPRLPDQLGALRGADVSRLRVLLLARTGRHWWTRLRWASALWAEDPSSAPTTIAHVGPPGQDLDRTVHSAASAFAARLGKETPDLMIGDLPGDAEPPRFGDVHAAVLAVLAREDTDGAAAVVDVVRGPGALLDHERDRWEDTDAVVARALLCGDPRGLPDRLAELHVARTLTAAPGMTEVCTAQLTPDEAVAAARFAFRLDIDTPAVTGAGRLTAAILERVMPQLPDDPEYLERVLRMFARRPVPVAQAVNLASRLVRVIAETQARAEKGAAAVPSAAGADDGPAADARPVGHRDTTSEAEALGAWSRALDEAGRWDEAREPAALAEAMWRRLADRDPVRCRVGLWRAKRDLAVTSAKVGRSREVAALVDECVTAWSAVPEAEALWTEPDLAWGMYMLEVTTGRPGRVDATRWYHDRAVELLRGLVGQDPVAYEETLALVQSNLLIRVNQGRPAEALAGLRESAAIRRRLARKRPDAFERHLAYSLSNLSHALAALGQGAEALAAGQEALALRRRAVRAASAVGKGGAPGLRFELAWSLSGVGLLLSEQGRPHEALALEEEALSIRRELTEASPDRYSEQLGTSCSNLGVTYSRLGRFGDALRLEQEAVEIRRDLAEQSAGHHRQYLARSLSNLGVRYSDMGRTEDAVGPTQEAVSLVRRLARDDRTQYLPDLATALANLGATLTDLGRSQEAVGPLHEAVGALRELRKEYPEKHLPGLASALTALSVALAEQRRHVSAAASAREAVRIRDRLAAVDQRRFGDDLARSVRVLADIEGQLPKDGARKDAVTVRSGRE
ncbi:hypothetical protein GCM10028784_24740 [Myceligenerans cantabricum]